MYFLYKMIKIKSQELKIEIYLIPTHQIKLNLKFTRMALSHQIKLNRL